jgi:hypothetical protein
MYRGATKDHYERDTEETERLIRESPKVKPPRRDLRRERTETDRDPDIDDDPDISKDKDLSLNYKTIGGSERVVARYLYGYDPTVLHVAARAMRADIDRNDYVAVINKETGESTHVKQDTLKGPDGAKYKVIKEEEKKGPTDDDSAKVLELAEKEPRLKGFLNTLADPKHKEHTTLTSLTSVTLDRVLKGIDFPPSIKTVGDLQAVVQAALKKGSPKKEGPNKAPRKPSPPKAQPETPHEEKAAPPGPKPTTDSEPSAPVEHPKPPIKPAPDDDYEYGAPSGEEKAALQNWISEGGHNKPDFKAWADKQKTISEQDGKLLFRTKGKARVPFEELSTADQQKVKSQFEKDTKTDRNVEAIKGFAQDPETRKTLQDLANPESELRKRLESTAREEHLDLSEADIAKTLPGLAHLKFPETFSSAQDVVDAAERILSKPAEPHREPVSKQEEQRAEAAIEESLPQEFVEHIAGMRLHPNQVNSLLSAYKASMSVDVPDDEVLTSAGYQLDPDKIEPPDHAYVNGKKTSFDDLTPEQRSEVYDRHKMQVLATSMAAKKRLEGKFAFTGLPAGPAKIIAETVLKSKGRPLADQAVQDFFHTSLATSFASKPLDDKEVKELFKTVQDNPAARKLVAAYVQASSYAQARDQFLSPNAHGPNRITEHDDPAKLAKKLQRASDFLKEKTKDLPPDTVVVDPAMAFRNRVIDRMSYLAPERVPYIRGYLKDYEMHDYEAKKKQAEKLTKDFDKAYEKEKKAREEELGKAGKGHDPYRELANQEEDDILARLAKKGISRPKVPAEPPEYDAWKNKNEVLDSAKRSFGWLHGLLKDRSKKQKERKDLSEARDERLKEEERLSEDGGPTPKQASLTTADRALVRHLLPRMEDRVAFRATMGPSYSSYSRGWAMGDSSSGVRTALYWGQEPYVDTQPYPGWQQLHARDFSQTDFDNVLMAAQEWLKLPVLRREIRGLYPDTQLRAALDLAIRDHENGKYSGGLYPTVYNELLARLSNQPGPYELLTTTPDDVPVAGTKNAGKSTYGDLTERGSKIMKASAQVRLFASRAASGTLDPELAFDLASFADHLAAEEAQAGQEQAGQQQAPAQVEQQKQAAIRVAATQVNKFNAVKAIVLKQATTYPTLREVFVPILQALKS